MAAPGTGIPAVTVEEREIMMQGDTVTCWFVVHNPLCRQELQRKGLLDIQTGGRNHQDRKLGILQSSKGQLISKIKKRVEPEFYPESSGEQRCYSQNWKRRQLINVFLGYVDQKYLGWNSEHIFSK